MIEELTILLYEALENPLGLLVTTTNPDTLRQKLYQARKMDETFASLSFVISPEHPESQLWIVHRKEKTNGPAQE